MQKIGLAMMGLLVTCYAADGAMAPVPQTGQTSCWQANAGEIPCDESGQDGDWQAGVKAPRVRFTNLNNGTVRDNLTGLVWLRDARCDERITWHQALTLANTLAHGQCSLTDGSIPGDWRMPNVKEFLSLFDYGQFAPALPVGHPFLNVPVAGVDGDPRYWTSTIRLMDAVLFSFADPFGINLTEGTMFGTGNGLDQYHLWAVRDR
jgi:hypothetical protein